MNKKIILADDHTIIREGLKSLIEKTGNMDVIGEAEDGRTTVDLVQQHPPDVVVMDIGMPNLNGIDATRQIIEKAPTVKVIGLSMHSDKRFVASMLKAGASGYLSKDCAFDELTTAIQTVMAGQIYLSPSIAEDVIEDYANRIAGSESQLDRLTNREREVLQLLAEGKTAKEIGLQLSICVKTVETHRKNIMAKLNLNNIAEITKYAIREGLTFVD